MGNERKMWGHPTQKPEKLFEIFVRWWSFRNDVVLDPFAGSGTTGKCCQNLGRNCILFEKDTRWKSVIEKRLMSNNQNLQYFMKEGEGENEIDDYENNRKGMWMFNKQHEHNWWDMVSCSWIC